MQEAWFLTDLAAIRLASGNPSGDQELELPRVRDLETLTDPKESLFELLRTASGLRGRRRRAFPVAAGLHRIAEVTSDFSGVRGLPAFQRMEKDLRGIIRDQHWNNA
jgi:hypothetical protein